MIGIIEETFEEIEKKFENFRLQIDIPFHMPFNLEDTLFYCIQRIHSNKLIFIGLIICHQVGS